MSDTGKPRILSVDDNAANLYARHRILANAGFEVIDAVNGAEALALLDRRPDLVVLDVGLPDIDGFEVCRRIKADPQTALISVLQVSASFVRGSDRTRALEGGADNFVVEPVEPEVLVATVRSLLRIRLAEERARRSAQEWVATFDAINEGVALLDAEERVQRCNSAFARVLAQPSADILGARWSDLLARNASEEGRIDSSSVGNREARASYCIAGRWVQVGTIALAKGIDASAVVVLTDVTDHMLSLRAAEDANRLKDEFLAVLSHELRTPLNAIVGWAQLLQMGQLGAPEAAKALQIINRNAQAQNQIISDILDVSSIIAGKLRLEVQETDLREVVEAALDTVRPSALAKEVRIETALDPRAAHIQGDPGRLQQVVWNILSNAIKYAPPRGNVRVRLVAVGATIEIAVEDNGPGVKQEFVPYVFDRFRQADSSSSRPKGGLGLGLAIVKHLVELHGGTVRVENRTEGTGALFTVVLPRVSSAVSARAQAVDAPWGTPSHTDRRLDGVRALIVDDEVDARDLVLAVLTASGADVLTAGSALEALPILERERPDVLICDIEMAGEDGLDFIRRLRALPPARGSRTPAVALTAYAQPEDAAAALQAGFQKHLAKPVRPNELVKVVDSLARRR